MRVIVYCGMVNLRPRFNFSNGIIILNLVGWMWVRGGGGWSAGTFPFSPLPPVQPLSLRQTHAPLYFQINIYIFVCVCVGGGGGGVGVPGGRLQ